MKRRPKSQNVPHIRRPSISSFAKRVRAAWTELGLPTADETVVVAVSGGADSTSLLLALDELIKNDKLGVNLVVGHLDHGLRQDSSSDARWVAKLAKALGHQVVVGKALLKTAAGKPIANLEQAARTKRYDFLLKTANKHNAEVIATAHTLDDQAETVLLRLLRGSAAEGLSGAPPVRNVKEGSPVKLARPLVLWARRTETEDYCRACGVEVLADELNDDETFSRVKVRKQLLPLMQTFNNRIVEALGRTASLLSEDAVALSAQASQLLKLATNVSTDNHSTNNETNLPSLDVKLLLEAPAAVRRRALRQWLGDARGDLRRLEMNHLVAVEKLLTGRGGSVAELPGSFRVLRKGQFLKVFNSEHPTNKGRTKRSSGAVREKPLKKHAVASKIPKR